MKITPLSILLSTTPRNFRSLCWGNTVSSSKHNRINYFIFQNTTWNTKVLQNNFGIAELHRLFNTLYQCCDLDQGDMHIL